MDAFNIYTSVVAVTLGMLSALFAYTGRQKYKDQTAFFESSNHELREQNSALREDATLLRQQLVQAQTESTQKDQTIAELKPFSEVVKIMSNNHKQIMTSLAEVTKLVTGKIDGR